MRVLLDENLHRRLARLFEQDLDVTTVAKQGWQGTKNGKLLRLAEASFDVFVTMDKGTLDQHNLSKISLAFVILSAGSNRYADTAPLIPKVNRVIKTLKPGDLIHVG